MKIDFTKQIVFLANSKVASTSLESALETYGGEMGQIDGHPSLKHLNMAQYLAIAGVLGTRRFRTVCVVRHPVDKVLSWYRYRARPQLRGKPRYTGDMTLAEFVERAPVQEIDDRCFVYDHERGKSVDLIFKYEDMASFTTWLRGVYGPEFELPRQNISPRRSADPAGLALARERFAEAAAWYETLETPPDRTGAPQPR